MRKLNLKKYVVIIVVFITIISTILLEKNVYATDPSNVENIAFADSNMYSKICEELKDKIIEKNDSEKSISINSSDINTITKLELNNSNIIKIDGIEKFTSLTELNINNNGINNINSLSSLKNLKSLSAYGNAITDLSPINKLNTLEYLDISKNRLSDNTKNLDNAVVKPISDLKNLTYLNISHNYIKYINGLSSLTKLTTLNLYDNAVCDLTGLETLTNLTSLNLGENNEKGADNGVKGLEALDNLTKLEEFDFSENKTVDITNHISKMTNLKRLSLQQNKIKFKNLDALGSLTNLEFLNLYYNEIEIIPQEFTKLVNLKELVLGNNWLYDITGFYKDDTICFTKLEKLDFSKNASIETMSQNEIKDNWTKRVDNNLKIMELLKRDIDELNDENITDTSSLPHKDENGIAYVTYDDFGARCDGKYDDYIAIRNAHIFANQNGCEVRATEGKTYHIFKYYEEAVIVKTNVDWKNATFIIHDENIEKVSGRFQGLFKFTNGKDETVINNPTWTIGKNTKKIEEIANNLKELSEKGYQRYLCAAINADKKQYIRYGGNSNSGLDQQDYFVVDNEGNVLNDIQWDFEKITTFTIYPISNTSLNIKNGNFITNAVESQSETPYTRAGSGKPVYFTRNIYVTKSTNVNISGINHKLSYELDKDELSGSYAGFINTEIVADIEISDCSLFTRKYGIEGRSTYDLALRANVNLKCKNITSNNITDLDRYGIICSLLCKDVSYENCKLNRIDAHEGIYNLTVKNCYVGSKGLTMIGQGTLNVIGTTIESDTFMTLRWDYGSTWTGDVNIIDCTYKYNGIWAPKLINVSLSYDNNELHDFGYECTMPNINVNNFTIDMQNVNKYCFYIMSINNMELKDPYLENTKKYLEKYLPDNINFNQYKFINTANDIKLEVTNTNGNGNLESYKTDYSYVISDVVLTKKDNTENLIKQIDFYGNSKFDKPLDLEINKNTLTQNKVSIYKDESAILENQPINDKFTYSFNEKGKYKIDISSLDEKNQYSGNKIYEFTLDVDDPVVDDENKIAKLKATNLGIGGGGALFFPAISPHNPNEMYVISDMGGIYVSHNKGHKWNRENLYGTVYAATYDPNIEGVIYAGGSGVYRSTDNGDSFELIFPRKDDIKARLIRGDYGTQYYMTHSKIYDPYKNIKSILVDPEDSNHIFVMGYYDTEGIVYESTDNGENFNVIFTFNASRYLSIYRDLNELFYKRETKELFLINSEGILKHNSESKEKSSVYKTDTAIIDAETVYENGKTYFIIIENTNELDNSYTKVYYTNDFIDKTDITSKFTSAAPTSFYLDYCGTVTYKYNFRYVTASSLNNIYISHATEEETVERGGFWVVTGIIRYHDNKSEYLFGVPFKDQETLTTRLWNDYNTEAYGIAVSKQVEEEFLMTHICGLLVAEDNKHIYPRYSTCVDGEYPNCKYTTNGIDEQTTYGVREDPFHKDVIFLLNTDLGLIKSLDNGKSWYRTSNGIPNKFNNTVYDLAFDERKENYVYSIWSSRHDVPYSAGNETDGVYGGFAISKDCGETWDVNYSSGLPEHANPVKMSVVYPENSDEVTIYLATFNKGFYVSYDSGKTFQEMNNGIEKVSYQWGDAYQYILASDIEVKDGKVFGITALSSYNNSRQTGKLYEYIDGKWNNIELPENTKIPRDIFYHNDTLYVCGTTSEVWDYKNDLEYNPYGGGVYTYKDGKFTQIFDETICTTGVQFDSRETMYVSDTNGNIYRKEKDKDYEKIYDSYHYLSKGIQISSDGDYLYLASFGGGLLKLENLNSLYEHKCSGGTATCTKKAVCSTCGKEYGELDENNHSLTSTHKENNKAASCSEEGYTGDDVYDCCNKIKEKGTKIEKLEHNYDDGRITKEATYEQEGEKTYTCEVCSETKVEIIPKLENDDVGKNTKTAIEAISEMKVGWNLGNALDCCNYKKEYLGTDKGPSHYETLWDNPVTTKEMIDTIKSAGFGSVRVPVTYYDHILDDGTIDELWFKRIEEVVNYVLDNDMYCIIDVHHDSGLCTEGSWIVADADKYEENAEKLRGLWLQIANRFKDYDYKLIFEGFNEIIDTDKNYSWITGYDNTVNVNKLNQVFVDTVRKTGGKNEDRFLAVSTFSAITDEHKLSNFVMPKDTAEEKIILALHDYVYKTEDIDSMLGRIKKYCIDKNIPVILDEFATPVSFGEDERARMAEEYVSKAKELGIACFVWDDGGKYKILDRAEAKWAYEKLKDALVKPFSNDEPLSFSFELNYAETTVKPGDTISMSGRISDIKKYSAKGLLALIGVLEYDKDVLELQDIKGLNNWKISLQDYNSENGKWVAVSEDYVQTVEDVFELTFKVKDNLENMETEVKLTNIEGGTAQDNIGVVHCDDAKNTIKIEKYILGDIDGDGDITINDFAQIKLHIIEKINLEGIHFKSGDLDKDGDIDVNDLAIMKLYLIEETEI